MRLRFFAAVKTSTVNIHNPRTSERSTATEDFNHGTLITRMVY